MPDQPDKPPAEPRPFNREEFEAFSRLYHTPKTWREAIEPDDGMARLFATAYYAHRLAEAAAPVLEKHRHCLHPGSGDLNELDCVFQAFRRES